METPNIGPVSPHFGPRRAAREQREHRDRKRRFEQLVQPQTEPEPDAESSAGKADDLQRSSPKRRRDGQDGGAHVDVLA